MLEKIYELFRTIEWGSTEMVGVLLCGAAMIQGAYVNYKLKKKVKILEEKNKKIKYQNERGK